MWRTNRQELVVAPNVCHVRLLSSKFYIIVKQVVLV